MQLKSRVKQLESLSPQPLVIGMKIVQDGEVLGVAPFRPDPAFETWAKSGQPKKTRAILFEAAPSPRVSSILLCDMHTDARGALKV